MKPASQRAALLLYASLAVGAVSQDARAMELAQNETAGEQAIAPSVVQHAGPAITAALDPDASSRLPATLPLRRDEAPVWQTGGTGPFGAIAIVMLVATAGGWVLWRRRSIGSGKGKGRGVGLEPVAGALSRWFAARPMGGSFQIAQSSRLSATSSLHVVHWNNRQFLLGCSAQNVSLLGEAPLSPQVDPVDCAATLP